MPKFVSFNRNVNFLLSWSLLGPEKCLNLSFRGFMIFGIKYNIIFPHHGNMEKQLSGSSCEICFFCYEWQLILFWSLLGTKK